MAAELIGRCKCPLCGSATARLSLAKSRLPVLTCNACNSQAFARSDRSDTAMRALLVSDEPAPAPEPEIKPAPVPAPPPARTGLGWGVLG